MGYASEKKKVENKAKIVKRIAFIVVAVLFLALIIVSVIFPVHTWKYRIKLPKINARADKEMRIHFIDVGQGDATIIELPDGKIMVIDGKVAFTGGINLADEYIGAKTRFGYWKDSGVRVTGSAVASFTKMFFDLWNGFRADKERLENYLLPTKGDTMYALKGGKGLILQPYDDSPLDKVSAGEAVYLDIIQRACRYAYVFTPYLVLDDYMRTILMQAAARGVDVRIVTPGIPDKKITYRLTRANYEILMKAGVNRQI